MIPIYAIRHRPSGKFLPQPVGRYGRGGSFVEPADPTIHAPRFFTSMTTAKIVLNYWLKGEFHHSSGVYYDHEGNPDYDEGIEIRYMAHRKAGDMEIVEFRLEETPV